jgi:hypothetical protein
MGGQAFSQPMTRNMALSADNPSQGKGQAAACTPRAAAQAAANLVYIRTIIWPVNKGLNVKPLGMDKYPESCYKRRL